MSAGDHMEEKINLTKKYNAYQKHRFNLEKTLNTIIDEFSEYDFVKEIWIFGSYVYGTPSDNSDLDICVVVDKYDIKIGHLSVLLGRILKQMKRNYDLIFVTMEDKEKNIDNYTSVYYDDFKKGKRLY